MSGRIVELHGRQQRRKIATSKGLIGQAGNRRAAGVEAEAFVVEHEERTVAPVVELGQKHRSGDEKAEIVLGIDRLRRARGVVGPTVRVQGAVAQIVVKRAMKLVRAGFQAEAYDGVSG